MEETYIGADVAGGQYWRELWRYRELLYFLVWRDFAVRYKQTVLGAAWGLIRPVLTTVVLTVVFGRIAKLGSDGVPYELLVLSGLLPWQLFATAMGSSSSSLVGNANLISKVYFPRLIVPLSSVFGSVTEFLLAGVVMIGVMVYRSYWPTWHVLLLPAWLALALAAATGVGLWLGALNVRFRDFTHIVPFLVQFGLYVSPVGFRSTVVPDSIRWLWYFNPMSGVIDGFRWCLLRDQDLDWTGQLTSLAVVAVLLVTGVRYFRNMERTFADVI